MAPAGAVAVDRAVVGLDAALEPALERARALPAQPTDRAARPAPPGGVRAGGVLGQQSRRGEDVVAEEEDERRRAAADAERCARPRRPAAGAAAGSAGAGGRAGGVGDDEHLELRRIALRRAAARAHGATPATAPERGDDDGERRRHARRSQRRSGSELAAPARHDLADESGSRAASAWREQDLPVAVARQERLEQVLLEPEPAALEPRAVELQGSSTSWKCTTTPGASSGRTSSTIRLTSPPVLTVCVVSTKRTSRARAGEDLLGHVLRGDLTPGVGRGYGSKTSCRRRAVRRQRGGSTIEDQPEPSSTTRAGAGRDQRPQHLRVERLVAAVPQAEARRRREPRRAARERAQPPACASRSKRTPRSGRGGSHSSSGSVGDVGERAVRPRGTTSASRRRVSAHGGSLAHVPGVLPERVVILCGGRGTRLQADAPGSPSRSSRSAAGRSSGTSSRSTPRRGCGDFVLLHRLQGRADRGVRRGDAWPEGVSVRCVDTGLDTPTGGRIHRVARARRRRRRSWRPTPTASPTSTCAALRDFHAEHGALATMTVVRPELQFGVAELDGDDRVSASSEKPRSEHWINGGFFVFEPGVLDYLGRVERARARAARGPGRRRAAARLPPHGLLGLHGHLQGRGPAQRPVGGGATRRGRSGREGRGDRRVRPASAARSSAALRARGDEVVRTLAAAADVVFHLAAQTDRRRRATTTRSATFEANVALTWRVLDAARERGVRRVVVASTDQVYGPTRAGRRRPRTRRCAPEGPYAASKAAADLLARALARRRVVVARLANVYGPGDRHDDAARARARSRRCAPAARRSSAATAAPRATCSTSTTPSRRCSRSPSAARRGEAYNVGTGDRAHRARGRRRGRCARRAADLEPEVARRRAARRGRPRARSTSRSSARRPAGRRDDRPRGGPAPHVAAA